METIARLKYSLLVVVDRGNVDPNGIFVNVDVAIYRRQEVEQKSAPRLWQGAPTEWLTRPFPREAPPVPRPVGLLARGRGSKRHSSVPRHGRN